MTHENRVGIATGAGRGMGRACAVAMAGLVDLLLVVDINGESAEVAARELEAETGVRCGPVALDVADPVGLTTLAEQTAASGILRAVVHAAGISPSMADWRRLVDVDLVGTARLTDVLFPLAVPGSALVCFASMAPFLSPPPDERTTEVLDDPLADDFLERLEQVCPAITEPGRAYSLAKLGVQRLVEREAVRFGRVGGRICSLSPGLIDTPMGRLEATERPSKKAMLDKTPLGRMGRATEIAAAVRFLLSEEASFVNGVDLLVDGGTRAALLQVGGLAAVLDKSSSHGA